MKESTGGHRPFAALFKSPDPGPLSDTEVVEARRIRRVGIVAGGVVTVGAVLAAVWIGTHMTASTRASGMESAGSGSSGPPRVVGSFDFPEAPALPRVATVGPLTVTAVATADGLVATIVGPVTSVPVDLGALRDTAGDTGVRTLAAALAPGESLIAPATATGPRRDDQPADDAEPAVRPPAVVRPPATRPAPSESVPDPAPPAVDPGPEPPPPPPGPSVPDAPAPEVPADPEPAPDPIVTPPPPSSPADPEPGPPAPEPDNRPAPAGDDTPAASPAE